MTERRALCVFGASGHAKVVAEAALRAGLQVVGFLDDDSGKWKGRLLNLPVLGGLESLPDGSAGVALGVGENRARIAVMRRLEKQGVTMVTVVHPSAVVSSGVSIGLGSYVGPGAVIHVDARVGRACIVNSGAVVEHDDVLADGVHISPNAALGGGVEIGEGVHIGLGAVVLPGVRVGAWSVVGAGSVVTKALPEGVVAAGAPARILRRLDPAEEP
jgi:sugar O-acyltransferase (sialic acid O-acetyltransferase NeuD family)